MKAREARVRGGEHNTGSFWVGIMNRRDGGGGRGSEEGSMGTDSRYLPHPLGMSAQRGSHPS